MPKKSRQFVLEPQAIEYLEKYWIPYPAHGFARSAKEAAEIADMIGFPVVLKVVSPDVPHKTDVGGVSLGLNDPDEVQAGYKSLIARVTKAAPGVDVKGILVCRQAEEGLEVIVGALDDDVFGPTVMFGLGGIFTEVLKDVSFRIVPLKRIDAEEMIQEIRGFPVLSGIRGQSRRDINGLVDLIVSVSNLVGNEPDIKELDLNPVRVYEEGVLTLDVRIAKRT